jgi:hypothetical protein
VVVGGFKSDGMNGREDEEELGNVGSACETEDRNFEDIEVETETRNGE